MNEARRDREVFYFQKFTDKFNVENSSSKLTFELKALVI